MLSPMLLDPVPPMLAESDWRFVGELAHDPVHHPVSWKTRRRRRDEVALALGICLKTHDFPDPENLLQTAYDDFYLFLKTVDLEPKRDGAFALNLQYAPTSVFEEYNVDIRPDGATLTAHDTEGIRRGLIYLEDEMLRRAGPYLPLGSITRTPVHRTRLSRCFYGPINRPPNLKDELGDEVDYYPEGYLNRLAHQGINALWLSIDWFRTIPSQIIPQYGHNAETRLAKLRSIVTKCQRYGIRIFPFCIEPAGFSRPSPELQAARKAHPDLIGHEGAFCVSTQKGKTYIRQAMQTLFTEVPGLGGLIVISVGERQTHCCSKDMEATDCPRCSKRHAFDVLADNLSAMQEGMHAANPNAILISWPYSQANPNSWGQKNTIEAAGHLPKGVVLQHNFEHGGSIIQLGKRRYLWDYWLSYVGPSPVFAQSARRAVKAGTRVFAKLQLSCSHELATTSYIPVPGLVYKKYVQMRKLGVSGAMHCWFMGAYPCLMSKAAGELSFDPFPKSEDEFLLSLARRDWGKYAPRLVRAWQHFQDSYSQYPGNTLFGYFGPMHDGVVWPLHLIPQRKPLAPHWQTCYPPSGDYISMCLASNFSLTETLELTGRMTQDWSRGARIMRKLLPHFKHDPDRLRDLRVALALDIQIRSAYNILHFYSLRETLADEKRASKRLTLLRQIKQIVEQEIESSRELLQLAKAESLLGFDAEAEGHKYDPQRIRWRRKQLQRLLRTEFVQVQKQIQRHAKKVDVPDLFPEYTGQNPTGPSCIAPRVTAVPMTVPASGSLWESLPQQSCDHWQREMFNPKRWEKCGYDALDHFPVDPANQQNRRTFFKICHDGQNLYIALRCTAGESSGGESSGGESSGGDALNIMFETSRTRPRIFLRMKPSWDAWRFDDEKPPRRKPPTRVLHHIGDDVWSTIIKIPLSWLDLQPADRFRMNVERVGPLPNLSGTARCTWVKLHPVKGRLVWDRLNPATDLGWIFLA